MAGDRNTASFEPIRKLLRVISSNLAAEIGLLLDELDPIFQIDVLSERNLVWSRCGTPNVIGMGMKCSFRLQLQSYAAGVRSQQQDSLLAILPHHFFNLIIENVNSSLKMLLQPQAQNHDQQMPRFQDKRHGALG